MEEEIQYDNFYEKYNILDKSKISYDIKQYESRCEPNTIQVNMKGMNSIHLKNLRHISFREVENLSIEYFHFKKYDTDLFPETIALKLQTIPLRYEESYNDIIEFDDYLQCSLFVNAKEGPVVVYPDMINFESYNTPLVIPFQFSRSPLFVLQEGEMIDIHCYISKGKPKTNIRWSSVNTFKYKNKNPQNVYSDEYELYIETDGSILPETLLEQSIKLL